MNKNYGIKHFVFPHCWISELPFLTALQAQWGWAYSLDAVLLAAGCNNPSHGGTGSGIYQGRCGALQAFQTNDNTSKLLIANVSKSFDCDCDEDPAELTNDKPKHEIDSFITPRDVDVQNYHNLMSVNYKENQSYLSKTLNEETNSSLVLLRDYLDVYNSVPLLPTEQEHPLPQWDQSNLTLYFTTETTLCHNSFCCDFKIEMETMYNEENPNRTRIGDDFSDSLYRLVVFDGVRWYGGGLATGGVQVCGVVACVNNSMSSCGLRADDPGWQPQVYGNLVLTGTVFHKIFLAPKFLYNNTFAYPNILVTGSGNEFGKLMSSDDFTYEEFGPYNNTILYTMETDVPVPNLVTAAIYARQFDRDGQKRTDFSSSYSSYNQPFGILIITVTLFIFHINVLFI